VKKNMGMADRVIRTVAAIVVGVLYFTHTISGTLALILGILAVIWLLTSVVSFCPVYTLVGLSTAGKEGSAAPKA
jgi:hypothetical protein